MEKTDPEKILRKTRYYPVSDRTFLQKFNIFLNQNDAYELSAWEDYDTTKALLVIDVYDIHSRISSSDFSLMCYSIREQIAAQTQYSIENIYLYFGIFNANNIYGSEINLSNCIIDSIVTSGNIQDISVEFSYILKDFLIDKSMTSVNIIGSVFLDSFGIVNATFRSLEIFSSKFYGLVYVSGLSCETVSLLISDFNKPLNLLSSIVNEQFRADYSSFYEDICFSRTVFLDNFTLSSCVAKTKINIDFYNTRLSNIIDLSSFVNCNFDFSNAVINGEVCFQNNNLSDSRFDNVDLSRNFRFNNVRWHPDGEIRGKLKLEEDARAAAEPEEKKRKLNQALKHYHELVIYYDSTRDIEQSERFFISEMELRKELSESWWEKRAYELYSIYSVYGTSWKRALFMLFVTLMFVVPLVLFVNDIIFTNKTDLTGISRYIEDSFRLLMLQKGVYDGVSGTKFFLQAISQLALLGQTALLFLAIRRHFRRSPSASQ